jgi:hypothetical protein
MPKYRKKPVIIEAFQLTKEFLEQKLKQSDARPVQETFKDSEGNLRYIDYHHDHAVIETLEGIMIANINDYIITGVKGEHYPCKPDIFEQTYERVEN